MVSYLHFPLDTWVITKHLRSRLDASALNRFRRDENDRITMVSWQVAASSQLAGTNDLVAPSNLELEEAVRLVAAECVRFREEESAAPKRVRCKSVFKSLNLRGSDRSETGPSAGPSPIKGKVAASKAQAKTPAGRRLVVHTRGAESAVPRPDAESYRSGWENREFEDHAEVVTPDQFDDQKGVERDHYSIKHYMQQLEDEIKIIYPSDVLEMLAAEKDGPSTSTPGAAELTPTAGLPGQTPEAPVIQPSPEVSIEEGFGAVVVSSDESNPATPLFLEAGPSAGVDRPSLDGEFDPRVWLDFSDPKWDRARNQLQGLVDHCLDPSLQRRRPGLGSYREQTGHYHADVSLRVRSKPAPRQ
ncbi:hypothetical protein PanWU01x14_043160 [Parasponia andersonii]|uniref:Uncharacterized protein n=1 Tax=Parasponia andersonii TaxID=3476 RepID=A0A2P5DQ15_PARAD|nr:hypothetical protein PanWU01x14_043160 [Parasponia andersonii]